MSDEDEAELRKEALAAQAEYYRLKSDELKTERARKEKRKRQVAFVARSAQEAAGDAVIKASESVRKTGRAIGAILLALAVIAVLVFLASVGNR